MELFCGKLDQHWYFSKGRVLSDNYSCTEIVRILHERYSRDIFQTIRSAHVSEEMKKGIR